MADEFEYKVGLFKRAGLEAKWSRTSKGAPIIVARIYGSRTWCAVDNRMWDAIKRSGKVMDTFKNYTVLVDFFSIPA